MCSNGWDDVTAALQLLSHLDGDALNVALLVPESQQVLSGVLMRSLSEHFGSPGRLAQYKHQIRRTFRRPGDDPSVFAIELETLARRAFADVDTVAAGAGSIHRRTSVRRGVRGPRVDRMWVLSPGEPYTGREFLSGGG